MRILVVEDNKDTAFAIKEGLVDYYLIELAFAGKEAEKKAKQEEYDVIVLDVLLPDISGIDVCKNLRKDGVKTPILMLTAVDGVDKKVSALDAGADDYLVKPFNFDELLARIRALLRRQSPNLDGTLLQVGDLTLDLSSKKVMRAGKELNLRRKEFYLLEYLMRNVGKVISRDMILTHVWKSMDDPSTNTIDVHIKYLRDQVDKGFDKKLIKTSHGLGYKIEV